MYKRQVNSDPDCSTSAFLCDSARGKYRKQYNKLVAILMLTRIRSVERGICPIAAVCTMLLRSLDPGHANVSETFLRGHVATIPGTCLSNLKFVLLAVLELLAFNAQKFTGSRDRDHAHFLETFLRCHVGTMPGNTPAKLEVCTFSHFGAISI